MKDRDLVDLLCGIKPMADVDLMLIFHPIMEGSAVSFQEDVNITYLALLVIKEYWKAVCARPITKKV